MNHRPTHANTSNQSIKNGKCKKTVTSVDIKKNHKKTFSTSTIMRFSYMQIRNNLVLRKFYMEKMGGTQLFMFKVFGSVNKKLSRIHMSPTKRVDVHLFSFRCLTLSCFHAKIIHICTKIHTQPVLGCVFIKVMQLDFLFKQD